MLWGGVLLYIIFPYVISCFAQGRDMWGTEQLHWANGSQQKWREMGKTSYGQESFDVIYDLFRLRGLKISYIERLLG